MFLIFECNNVFEIISDKARNNLLQTHIWPISSSLPPIVLILKNKGWLLYELVLKYSPVIVQGWHYPSASSDCNACVHALKPRHPPGTGLT